MEGIVLGFHFLEDHKNDIIIHTVGAVGNPFPTVEVRIVSPSDQVMVQGNSVHSQVTPGFEGEAGELQVKGPAVFQEYWNKPDATRETFTEDGWFKTGIVSLSFIFHVTVLLEVIQPITISCLLFASGVTIS